MSLSTERNDSCDSKASCEFQENVEILRQTSFFAGLPLEPVKVFAYLCVRETFKEGEMLFQQDDTDGQAFYIISGKARLVREDDGETRELAEYEEGDFLGSLSLLGDMRRLFSLRAESETLCLVLTREKFLKTVEQFPDITLKMVESLVQRIRKWEKGFYLDHVAECESCGRNIGVSLV